MISEHLSSWLGYPVHPLGFEELKKKIPDLSRTICRLYIDFESEGTFAELFSKFIELPGADRTPGIIVGAFMGDDSSLESVEAVNAIVNAKARLTALRGIFLGDIISEENEISWINQCDVSPLLTAYPQLEHLGIRGGTGLILGSISHRHLKSLVIQTGGLPSSVVADVVRAQLPALEHLELWLGEENYGWDGTVADLQPLLNRGHFPALRQLGLRNSAIQDEIAAAAAGSPIIDQLQVLDLSMGSLSDKGAEALLGNPAFRKLQKLDLHYHYLSPAMEQRLRAAFPNVDVSDRQEADEDGDDVYRSISVSE